MTNAISLQVNTDRLFHNLKDVFSNSNIIFRELVQNARRAGATKVDFQFDVSVEKSMRYGSEFVFDLKLAEGATSITVRDNGHGINNLQDLFTLSESGWDTPEACEENPFGMGFFSTLYAAPELQINSGFQQLRVETQELLDGKLVEASTVATPVKGTEIKLIDTPLAKQGTINYLMTLAETSSIDIHINGELLRSPYSQQELTKGDSGYIPLEFEYGTLYVASWALLTHDPSIKLALQDIVVYKHSPTHCSSNAVIGHLHSSIKARMPDRDKLIDQEVIVDAAKAVLKEKFKERLAAGLEHAKQQGGAAYDSFICDNFKNILKFSDLAMKLDRIPSKNFKKLNEAINDRCVESRHHDTECAFAHDKRTVTAADIKKHPVLIHDVDSLIDPDWECCDDSVDFTWAAWAIAAGVIFYDGTGFPKDHWINELFTDVSELKKPTVVLENPQEKSNFSGEYAYAGITLCSKVEIEFLGINVEIKDAYYDGGNAIIPDADKNPIEAVAQMSAYRVGEWDEFDGGALDRDQEAFSDFIRRARATTPAELLSLALKDLGSDVLERLGENEVFSLTVKEGEVVVTQAAA